MKNNSAMIYFTLGLLGFLVGVAPVAQGKDKQTAPKNAEPATVAANARILKELPLWNTDDIKDASRGFIATLPDGIIYGDDGSIIWNLPAFDFLYTRNLPSTINPSLWRQALLNMNNGLYQITDHIYQVRGFDLASMMIIEGTSGIILIDPMSSNETASAALSLYRANRGNRPVKALIYTHCHSDHYSGAKGVISEEDAESKKVPVIAPDGFLDHAVSENVFAGTAMARRSFYSYGNLLPINAKGLVDSGLGKMNSLGTMSLIAPNINITDTSETLTIDGVTMVFRLAPETEAPVEMLIWFPQFKALCAAEDMNHLNHNLYTLRGAQVRDARAWWKVLNDALYDFSGGTEVIFFAHTWPIWGKLKIIDFMKKQRDLYKYVHDQSLHMANQGYTMTEIAEKLVLPPSLSKEWFDRDYYGTVNHNAKAVYQRYIGWYDCNPANLHSLPPEDAAKRYVEYMGGAQAVIARARKDFKAGNYRWVAQVMNHVVFAEPHNREAKELEADALEQLGYQAESATWRNHYLTGAQELRQGVGPNPSKGNTDQLKAMTVDLYFDYLGICLDGPKANGQVIALNWNFTDPPPNNLRYVMTLENSALTYRGPLAEGKPFPPANATLNLTRATLNEILVGNLTWNDAIASGAVMIQGDPTKFQDLLKLLDTFEVMFNIVTP